MPTAMNSGAITASITGSVSAVGAFDVPSASQTCVAVANGKAGTSITSGTGVAVRTTTASKVFYVTSITLGVIGATNPTFDVRDGTTIAGTLRWSGGSLLGTNGPAYMTITFPTPLVFSTGIFLDTGNGGPHTIVYAFSGFEQ